ncbi:MULTISPECIES: CDP-glycerol glycerophosphotransferase family protein [Bacillus]|uniref:CDP-glycerol glycerophosphotransferase (TagB/SpsB family) n=1 Tax=Bacillus aerius TaxID=293388 RepID=A0ABR6AXJ5_9BACI|nr:CDP-glycerol glycerophosphotransferase (TagB/SpsB family) [Bacillus aerius]
MSHYIHHYWQVYFEYVNLMKDLSYRHIPLGLISNFYQYISPEVRERMEDEAFGEELTTTCPKPQDIQPFFDQHKQQIKRTPYRPSHGKVLLHFEHLRFTEQNYTRFHPNQTVVLARWKKADYFGLPVISKPELAGEVNKEAHVEYIEKANALLKPYAQHPVFGNVFFREKLRKDIVQFIDVIDQIETLFEMQPITAVVVGTTEDAYSRVLALQTVKRHLTSICLQHGALMGDEAFLPIFTTCHGVFGKYEKDWYVDKGCQPEQVEITGHPRFDLVQERTPLQQEVVFRKLNFNPAKKTVLVATQPFSEAFYGDILKTIAKRKDIQLIMKPHPWEIARNRLNDYTAIERAGNHVRLIKKEIDLYDLLPYMDMVITLTSTVGLEAMLFKKSVLIGKMTEGRRYPYYESLGSYHMENPIELAEKAIRILSDEQEMKLAKQQGARFIQEHYPHAQSTDVLLSLLKTKTGVDFQR